MCIFVVAQWYHLNKNEKKKYYHKISFNEMTDELIYQNFKEYKLEAD